MSCNCSGSNAACQDCLLLLLLLLILHDRAISHVKQSDLQIQVINLLYEGKYFRAKIRGNQRAMLLEYEKQMLPKPAPCLLKHCLPDPILPRFADKNTHTHTGPNQSISYLEGSYYKLCKGHQKNGMNIREGSCHCRRSASVHGGTRLPSPRRNSSTSKSAHLPPQSWPEPDYQPEALPSPREANAVLASSSEFEEGRLGGDQQESPAQAMCSSKLAQVFEERPEVREKLMDLLADAHSQDDEALKLQVSRSLCFSQRLSAF